MKKRSPAALPVALAVVVVLNLGLVMADRHMRERLQTAQRGQTTFLKAPEPKRGIAPIQLRRSLQALKNLSTVELVSIKSQTGQIEFTMSCQDAQTAQKAEKALSAAFQAVPAQLLMRQEGTRLWLSVVYRSAAL